MDQLIAQRSAWILIAAAVWQLGGCQAAGVSGVPAQAPTATQAAGQAQASPSPAPATVPSPTPDGGTVVPVVHF